MYVVVAVGVTWTEPLEPGLDRLTPWSITASRNVPAVVDHESIDGEPLLISEGDAPKLAAGVGARETEVWNGLPFALSVYPPAPPAVASPAFPVTAELFSVADPGSHA